MTVFGGSGADPAAAWRRARRVDPAAADALGERRPLPADLVPRARGAAAAVRRRNPWPLVQTRLRPLPPDRRRVPRARRGAARGAAAGTTRRPRAGSSGSGQSTAASTLDGPSAASFRHVLVAPGHPGLERPGGARRRPARRPRLRAARVRRRRGRRRRRHGGGDRVAERARRRRARHLGAAAGARAAAAQRAAAALLAPRARRASTPRAAERARGAARPAARALVPARRVAGTSRSSRGRRAASASQPEVNGAEQVICATGFRRGFRARSAARAARRRARARDTTATGSCSRPTAPCRRSRTASGRWRSRASRRSGPTRPPTRWSGAKYAAHGFLRRVRACPTR